MATMLLGLLAHYQGDSRLAWATVREILPRGPATEPGDRLFSYAVEMQRLAAEMALDTQQFREVRRWLEAHDHWLDWSGAVRGRAESFVLWARLHRAEGDLTKAHDTAIKALARASQPRQPLALLAVYRLLGQFSIDDCRFPEAAEYLEQSAALAEDCAAPFEQALTMLVQAELFAATNQKEKAESLIDEIRGIGQSLGAAPLLARVDTLAERVSRPSPDGNLPAQLTAREIEVLCLVADGLTDAEVAERLYLSPRTVGQHLRSIYNKLGLNSRTAATRFAVEHQLV